MDKLILPGYVFASFVLFLFSYTQVDLSLTLSRVSIFQTIQKSFQYIGFYQRPLSAVLFVLVVLVLFLLYVFALRARKLSIWKIVIPISVVLVFSYPAFSYDIFNYMFDAKTVLVYQKLPYNVSPLSFSGVEPWLSFMHWTHIPSTFPPIWVLLTLPFYLMGFGYFLGILWSFKLLAAIGYVASVWLIYRILRVLDPDRARMGAAIFALNPLVIVESLVSSHNDIVMMAFALFSFYLYLMKKRTVSFFLLSLSVATKIMTLTLLPLFLVGWRRSWALILSLVGTVSFLIVTKRELQPWYLLWVLPWVSLLPREKWLTTVSVGMSLGMLLRYTPYLFTGGYAPPVPEVMTWIVAIATVVSLLAAFAPQFMRRV